MLAVLPDTDESTTDVLWTPDTRTRSLRIHSMRRNRLPIMVPTHKHLRATIVLTVLGSVAGCVTQTHDAAPGSVAASSLEQRIAESLSEDNQAEARNAIASELRTQPQNGYLHLLNGLSYQLEDDSFQSLTLAKVGYDAAVRFASGHYWSHYLAGAAALGLSNFAEAGEHFSKAILVDPEKPHAFVGLAIASYLAEDLDVAHAVADRAIYLAPTDPSALRTAAYIAAARGERLQLEGVLAKAQTVPLAANELNLQKPRLTQLLRTASAARTPSRLRENQTESPPPGSLSPQGDDGKQVMVEVTLLLNQDQTSNTQGINLLDGLRVQFGFEHLTTNTRTLGVDDTYSRVFTSAIRVPDITYSLNLFNTKDDYYRVVARPSLVAYLNQESQFFIGRAVTVGVSGINLGSLQPIDVGITVKVTPNEITPNHANFKVEITRSFFDESLAGTFAESLTTFKQTVSATAEVDFGKTLILSGLYEAVQVGGLSKTPVLGDIPVVDTFFNARSHTDRQDVALVLVTPRRPGSVDTDMHQFRGETLNSLLNLWRDLVDPMSNMDVIIGMAGRTNKKSKFFYPQAGDVRLPPISDPATIGPVIKETFAQLSPPFQRP